MAHAGGRKKGAFLIATMIAAAVFSVGFGREYLKEREIARQIAQLEAENDRLEGQRLEFLDLIDRLSSEYYLESQARTKEGLAKPGETLLVVVDPSGNAVSPEGQVLGEEDRLTGMSNPTRWFYYFFDQEKVGDEVQL